MTGNHGGLPLPVYPFATLRCQIDEAMKYDPDKHARRSIRLRGYEYTQSGAYFVTICTQNRDCLFGEIVKGIMDANDAGRMIQSVWDELPQHYPGVDVDAFVVMPNHIHGIILWRFRV